MTLLALTAITGGLAVLAGVLGRIAGPRAGWVLAAALAAVAAGFIAIRPSTGVLTESVSWIPAIDVALRLRLDGLAFLFVMVVLVIGALVMLYSASYLKERRPAGFYALMVAFAAAMVLLVLADDLVVMVVAWELTTLCSYLLILRSGPKAVQPASRTLLITVAGGLCLLTAAAFIVVRTGTTELSTALTHPVWSEDAVFSGVVAALVAIAAMTKAAQFPFHSWLPDAMVAPAPVSAYLHAAAMVKAGVYMAMRFADAAAQSPVWPVMLVTAGLVTAVMGAVFALQRSDLKELMAYSTVSQLGLLFAVIGIGTAGAMLAASVHIVAHALFKSAGFMYVGLLERRADSREISELNGLARAMPWTSGMAILAMASMAGIPPLLGFISKETIFDAFLEAPGGVPWGWVTAILAAAAAVGTVAYSARVVVPTLTGPRHPVQPLRGMASMTAAISVTALAGPVLGLGAGLLDDLVVRSAAATAGVPVDHFYGLGLWHGINAPLLLSATVIATGIVLVLRGAAVERLLNRRMFPGSGVGVVSHLQDATIAAGRRVGDLTRGDAPASHLSVPVVVLAVAGLAGALGTSAWIGEGSSVEAVDVALLLVIAVGCVAMIRSGTRLGAIIAAGIVGFTVAVWFFTLGAADVALTQLLVEILTVVIMVLVLRRLPARFRPASRQRRTSATVAAVAAGVAATVATLALTGHRPLSAAGEYFLREAEDQTGGTNVVNTILVDFRALDTLGELVVLAVAALAMAVLLNARQPLRFRHPQVTTPALADPAANSVFLGVLARGLVPLMLLGSGYALLRGHNAPGGGFIAALIGAAAVTLSYLAAPSDRAARLRLPYLPIAGGGIVVATVSGLLGLVEGAYLRPLHADFLGVHLTTALVFDLGVYLAVFGVILAALDLLGRSQTISVSDSAAGRSRPSPNRAEVSP